MMNPDVISTVGFSTNIVSQQQNEPNDSDAFGTQRQQVEELEDEL